MSWFADWHGVDLLRFHRALFAGINQPRFNLDDLGVYMKLWVRIAIYYGRWKAHVLCRAADGAGNRAGRSCESGYCDGAESAK